MSTTFTRSTLLSFLVLACTKPDKPAPVVVATVDAAAVSPHTELDIETCLPVGYGLSCAAKMRRDGGTMAVGVRVCVADYGGPEGLAARVGQAPITGHEGKPLHMWVDTRPAKDDERYCGVLIVSEIITAFGP